jgi:inner membrane protein
MIFSHAPGGFIAAFITRRWWSRFLSKRQITILYIISMIVAIFPDIDIIYYYLINATTRHRQHITHSLFLYLFIWLLFYLVGFFKKSRILKSVGFILFIGGFSHLVLDSTTTGVPWLYPFSSRTWGLLLLPWFNFNFVYEHLFLFTLSVEILIFLLALNILFFWKSSKKIAFSILILSIILFNFWIIFLQKITPHLFNGRIDIYYSDLDSDGIINMEDDDMDGDGILNISDLDANGNGKSNLEDIIATANRMQGVWYDKTEGGFFELFTRLGLIINTDVIKKPYEHAGIFWRKEMLKDYNLHPQNYTENPSNALFERKPQNIYTFLKNNDMLIDANARPKIGDIAFYGKELNHLALVLEVKSKNNFKVLDADPSHKTEVLPNEKVVERAGAIKAFGRLLKLNQEL